VEPELRRESLTRLLLEANKAWHGVKVDQPDWGPWSHSLAITSEVKGLGFFFHLILNAFWEPQEFELPPLEQEHRYIWRRWIDTSLDSPNDIVEWETAPAVPPSSYPAGARSVVILIADARKL
jgi:glycogen operon protein